MNISISPLLAKVSAALIEDGAADEIVAERKKGIMERNIIVREGRIKRGCKVRLIRDGIVRYTGELGSLKRMKDDVKEVTSGYDCGLSIAGYNDVQEGDLIEAYEEVEVKKSL